MPTVSATSLCVAAGRRAGPSAPPPRPTTLLCSASSKIARSARPRCWLLSGRFTRSSSRPAQSRSRPRPLICRMATRSGPPDRKAESRASRTCQGGAGLVRRSSEQLRAVLPSEERRRDVDKYECFVLSSAEHMSSVTLFTVHPARTRHLPRSLLIEAGPPPISRRPPLPPSGWAEAATAFKKRSAHASKRNGKAAHLHAAVSLVGRAERNVIRELERVPAATCTDSRNAPIKKRPSGLCGQEHGRAPHHGHGSASR